MAVPFFRPASLPAFSLAGCAAAFVSVLHGALVPVPGRDVKIEDAFWAPKLEVWRGKTIHDVLDKFESHGGIANFDRVAAGQKGGHCGEPWWDGLVYETLTAAADFLAVNPDPVLQQKVDRIVARIAAAAAVDQDGYVNTGATLDGIGHRWSEPPAPGDDHEDSFPHMVYNAGCLVEAAVHLHRATGDLVLLRTATRMANYMCGLMGPPPKQNIIPGHAIPEQAFVELYRLYHERPELAQKVGLPVAAEDFLKLAEFWIEARGHTHGRGTRGAYNQDDMSVFRQPALEGHSVRACLLGSGIATAAAVNGREDYRATGERWWNNMAEAKIYITGATGSVPETEGFGEDYDLPNDGYNETCAAVAAGFFSASMNLLTGESKYVDVVERELYNGALSGVSLEGDTYFYTNFLEAGPEHRRWSWMGGAVNGTPCCPPMFLKLQASLPGSVYATGDSGGSLYVNHYLGNTAQIAVAGNTMVTVNQETAYPWEGVVKVTLTPEKPVRFAMKLRIPAWAQGAKATVAGETLPGEPGTYLVLVREWQAGDTVTLDLPMSPRRVKADPRVKANTGRVALVRGPVVYCLEGLDQGGSVASLQLPEDRAIVAEKRPDLLGGVTVLRGSALRLREDGGTVHAEPQPFTAIPFYANANRQPTDMAVWIADEAAAVRPVTLAGGAVASASHCFGNDTVTAVNDGRVPEKSDDESVPRLTWWDHRGTREWVQLSFPVARTLDATEVYWWDERRLRRDCRVPQSWHVQYLASGGSWQPVAATGEYGTQMDAWNRIAFLPVTTTALRLSVQLQSGWSAGILEWKVESAPPPSVPR